MSLEEKVQKFAISQTHTGETMQLLPSKKPEVKPKATAKQDKSKLPANALPKTKASTANLAPASSTLALLTFLALGLIGLISFVAVSTMPKLAAPMTVKHRATQLAATTVTIQNSEDNSTLRVFWGNPVSQTEFWFDGKAINGNCNSNSNTCTLPKPNSSNQLYFRWLDNSDNQWYYFSCNGDYRGEFQGVPYSVK